MTDLTPKTSQKTAPKPKKLVVFISGTGSNLHSILQSPCADNVVAVVSDNPNATGLGIAQQYNKDTHIIALHDYPSREIWERALIESLAPYQLGEHDLIALAGFMKVLSADFIAQINCQIINIHPSLLPQFPGLNTHQRAIDAKVEQHGCTIHYVNHILDGGEIIAQKSLAVFPTDTAETLQKRVKMLEHDIYPKVIYNLLQ